MVLALLARVEGMCAGGKTGTALPWRVLAGKDGTCKDKECAHTLVFRRVSDSQGCSKSIQYKAELAIRNPIHRGDVRSQAPASLLSLRGPLILQPQRDAVAFFRDTEPPYQLIQVAGGAKVQPPAAILTLIENRKGRVVVPLLAGGKRASTCEEARRAPDRRTDGRTDTRRRVFADWWAPRRRESLVLCVAWIRAARLGLRRGQDRRS